MGKLQKKQIVASDNLLAIPANAGQAIIQARAVIACPVLGTDKFLTYCRVRGLSVDRERLLRLERLGLFAPLFRVRTPPSDVQSFHIPVREENDWFSKGWAWDTTGIPTHYDVPLSQNQTQEGYYSIFQIAHLSFLLISMTRQIQLDSFLEHSMAEDIDWIKNGRNWMQYGEGVLDSLRSNEYRRSVPLLCQYISNRYYSKAQSNKRTIRTGGGCYSDQWIVVNGFDWDWHKEVQSWNPQSVANLFDLTPQKLRHAYNGLAIDQAHRDPLEHWYQLTQFISVRERERLKGDALLAETLRSGAHMLRLLYKDLYDEELPHPNEVTGTIINHIPELAVRKDVRRYLEFVVNRFNLNPQPKLALIVEGQSEESAVLQIFEGYLGAHPGIFGIEVIVLGSVDKATGSKREDRFRSILRLVDYLHHHQTITFIILDNENYALRLKQEAKRAKSIHSDYRYITRPEYIKVWGKTFEFDNFSCREIATAMNEQAVGHANFTASEVVTCKNSSTPGACLQKLYEGKTRYGLQKPRLNHVLAKIMMSSGSRRKIENRPIVKILKRVAHLASRNPLPTMNKIWMKNQASKYLGKKHKPVKRRTKS